MKYKILYIGLYKVIFKASKFQNKNSLAIGSLHKPNQIKTDFKHKFTTTKVWF